MSATYMNDIKKLSSKLPFSISIFCRQYISFSNSNTTQTKISKVTEWLNVNKLLLNIKKELNIFKPSNEKT